MLISLIYFSGILNAILAGNVGLGHFWVPQFPRKPLESKLDVVMTDDVPQAVDWRDKGLVTEVKNQGSCDAGWAFAVAGFVEGVYAKKYGELLEFSAQQLLDCTSSCQGCGECAGLIVLWDLNDLGGLQEDSDYKYVGNQQKCKYKQALSRVQVTSVNGFRTKNETLIKTIVATEGPLYVEIDDTSLADYKQGILEKCTYKKINNSVLLVGYGSENGTDFWIIKNSKGTLWGDKGYAKIRRGVNACGMTQEPFIKIEVVKQNL